MEKLQSHDWNGLSMKQKQLNMLAFTWELVYELMLAPKDNCSESPGFERFSGTSRTMSEHENAESMRI